MRLVEPFLEMIGGLKTTLFTIFEKPVTVQYPEEKRQVSKRYRGRHELKRYDNGLEKCIGCALCAAACPADAIVFGRIDDPASKISVMAKNGRGFKLLDSLGTLPRITYLKEEKTYGRTG